MKIISTCQIPGADNQSDRCTNPDKYEIKLLRKLKEHGVECSLYHKDGERYVDIAIPKAHLMIVISKQQHPYSFREWDKLKKTDTEFLKEPVKTLYVSNQDIKNNSSQVFNWILGIILMLSDPGYKTE